jgi:hypothetical protein
VPRSTLAYMLTDPTGRYYWAAPGMRKLGSSLGHPPPLWPNRALAQRAATAIRKAIGVHCVPCPVRCPRRAT